MKNRSDLSIGLAGFFFIAAVILQGCAAAKPRSVLMDNQIELRHCKENKTGLWWEKPGFAWNDYDRVMIEPIVIKIDNEKFKQGELQTAVNDFRQIIIEGLSPQYLVVDEPGPHVLEIRSTITDIDTSSPALNALTTAALFVPLDMGGATIEVEFLNSISGERVAAMVDQKTGTPLEFTSNFSRFGHAREAFEKWAKELKLALVTNP